MMAAERWPSFFAIKAWRPDHVTLFDIKALLSVRRNGFKRLIAHLPEHYRLITVAVCLLVLKLLGKNLVTRYVLVTVV